MHLCGHSRPSIVPWVVYLYCSHHWGCSVVPGLPRAMILDCTCQDSIVLVLYVSCGGQTSTYRMVLVSVTLNRSSINNWYNVHVIVCGRERYAVLTSPATMTTNNNKHNYNTSNTMTTNYNALCFHCSRLRVRTPKIRMQDFFFLSLHHRPLYL